jgi:hypothetical protein
VSDAQMGTTDAQVAAISEQAMRKLPILTAQARTA